MKIFFLRIWLIIHKFTYYNIFNKKFLNTNENSFNVIAPSVNTNKFIEKINNFFTSKNIKAEIKDKLDKLPPKFKYRVDLYDLLDLDLKSKIVEFALFNKNIREYNLNYFGFHPRIHRVELLYNLPNKNLVEEGSK